MTNEEREKEIRKQPILTKEECLAFYEEAMKLSDVRFVPYYKMAIKALEQTSWIPVSERLPEKDEWVLITFDNDIEIALLDDDGWCYSSIGNDDWIAEHPPVAWMPLPQPYKAESEE